MEQKEATVSGLPQPSTCPWLDHLAQTNHPRMRRRHADAGRFLYPSSQTPRRHEVPARDAVPPTGSGAPRTGGQALPRYPCPARRTALPAGDEGGARSDAAGRGLTASHSSEKYPDAKPRLASSGVVAISLGRCFFVQ